MDSVLEAEPNINHIPSAPNCFVLVINVNVRSLGLSLTPFLPLPLFTLILTPAAGEHLVCRQSAETE